ncbi:unnamed protein product, partial [Rangifer tarandus platyrhynchus]
MLLPSAWGLGGCICRSPLPNSCARSQQQDNTHLQEMWVASVVFRLGDKEQTVPLQQIRNSWFQAGPPEAPFPGGLRRLRVSSQNGEKVLVTVMPEEEMALVRSFVTPWWHGFLRGQLEMRTQED